ncbi:NAD-dependent epimerase/dehydratase family protein [Marinicella sp. W31]|uniref:NAD-dependent epimerase/dehydratase family protein n=1 Tax=Marinicella sp. W31 TaxID=3023713 RepID=UPI0037584803
MQKKTVLVTGGTGYLGAWVVKRLLERNYNVRLVVRSLLAAKKFVFFRTIAQQSSSQLELFQADLLQPGSFDDAAKGSDAIIHMAAPNTSRFTDIKKEILQPIIMGTKNVLLAANRSNTIKKVVLTSSASAIYGDRADRLDRGIGEFTEAYFNHTSTPKHKPYAFAKVEAEELAWEMYKRQSQWKLTILNPALMLGPNFSQTSNSESLSFFKQLIQGKFSPQTPALEFAVADVRDIAIAQVNALNEGVSDSRFILFNEIMSLLQMGTLIEQLYPQKFNLPKKEIRKLFKHTIPKKFGYTQKYVERNIGFPLCLSNRKSRHQLGLKYRPIATTFKDMISSLKL